MRIALLAALPLAALVAGCGPVECQERVGSYMVRLDARTGNCGAVGETISSSADGASSPNCVDKSSRSADQCTVTIDRKCTDSTVAVTVRGTVHWQPDAKRATGVVELQMAQSTGATCQGTYDVVYTKL